MTTHASVAQTDTATATASATTTTSTMEPSMGSSTPTPTTSTNSSPPVLYYAMVIDSGPIIKQEIQNLVGKATKYVTTSSVIHEIRDSKSRQYLNDRVIPLLDLQVKEPTEASIQQVIQFAKQTGDYASLSSVDLQVLALTIDLEKEGCSSLGSSSISTSSFDHIRTTPKRKIGLGSILPMNNTTTNTKSKDDGTIEEEKKGEEDVTQPSLLGRDDYDEVEDDSDDEEAGTTATKIAAPTPTIAKPIVKSSWANLANPAVDVDVDDTVDSDNDDDATTATTSTAFASMKLSNPTPSSSVMPMTKKAGAQTARNVSSSSAFAVSILDKKKKLVVNHDNDYNDGDNDGDSDDHMDTNKDDENNDGQFDDASEDEEEEPAQQQRQQIEDELELEFPSLLAAVTVPYEGEDDDDETNDDDADNDIGFSTESTTHETKEQMEEQCINNNTNKNTASVFLTDAEKQQNLRPVSKQSGKVYNSFRKYKGLMKPKQKKVITTTKEDDDDDDADVVTEMIPMEATTTTTSTLGSSSRIMGSGGGESMLEADDDGQGWITSFDEMKVMKNDAGGRLDPGKASVVAAGVAGTNNNSNNNKTNTGPLLSQRTACVTTDFAMQNVLLQMNLLLLNGDSGMRIRRLKSWVIRCGACYKIHGACDDFKDDTHHAMKRLFCSHCGSGDMMQRISASVDGKTGRLKLHFSKRKQGRHHSIRGTKFSLPKSGVGKHNRFKGDLLLREDQLLTGVWNQKVKINSGHKYQTSKSQSIFGRDIASSVGCNVQSTSSASFVGKNGGWSTPGGGSNNGFTNSTTDDIKVGFGARKNPNAAKGRERRGKKKTSSDRACGMRRY